MRINQNIYALNAQRNLQNTNNQLSVSLERLSSGLRINRASDDAAGLAISEKLRAQVSGLGVSTDNANDGISLIRTAEGALDRVNAILKRMRDLVGWAANGDKTDADRQKYQDEINQLTAEINRISTTTEYNTKKLLNGELGTKVEIVSGTNIGEVENIGVSGTVGGTGRYYVSVETAGQENIAAIGLGTTTVYPVTTSLAGVLGETGSTYTKTITVSQADGKTAQVTLNIGGSGDTIETMLNKLNTAFTNAGMKAQATFDSKTNEVKLTSTEVGSKYNLTWIESNSKSDAKTFTGAYQLAKIDGLQSVGEYYTLNDAFGLAITSGSTSLVRVTFGNIDAGSTLSAALNLDSAATLTFTLTVGSEAVVVTAAETVTVGGFVDSLNTALEDYGIEAVFDDDLDAIMFVYGNDSGRISDYGVTAGTAVIGTAGTEINYTVGVLTFTATLGNDQMVEVAVNSDVAIGKFANTLGSLLNGYGLSVTASFDDAQDAILFTYDAGSTKIETLEVTSGGTLTYSLVGEFNPTDKVSADSIDVTVLVTDPITNEGRTVTSTSREFAAGTGGAEISVDSSGISGVTFTLTNAAAKETETAFDFDLSKGSITLQIGPNAGTDHRMEVTINDMGSSTLGVDRIDVTTQANAQAIIDAETIDKAIEKVVTERGKLGAYENRLNHTIQNLGVAKENLTSAESRLRDADIAKEMMDFTRNQIMLQAGTAMLAQANTVPQTVLQLLR